jgi:hypothetical protein
MITEKQKYNISKLSLDDHIELINIIFDRRGLVQYHDYNEDDSDFIIFDDTILLSDYYWIDNDTIIF